MELKRVKTERCLTCGATPVAEKIEGRHVNGEDREVRAFACGAAVEWSLNFSREVARTKCPRDPAYRAEADTRALDSLRRSLDYCGDLAEEKKQKVRDFLKTLYPAGVAASDDAALRRFEDD